jgi:TatD DNase family protein
LAATLFDTHFHLDLFPDPAAVVKRCETQRIHTIAVTNAPCVFEKSERLTRGMRYLRPALGLHPELAVERRGELALFRTLLPRTRYIGEVGLDYSTPSQSDRKTQRFIFTEILGLCSEAGDKVLTVHSRRAAEDVVDAIGEAFRGSIILHWYSVSVKTLDRALAAGAYISVNTAMCEGKRFSRLLSHVPADRVLTETDGPFVTVQGRRAEPSDVREVVAALSRAWGRQPSDVIRMLHENFARVLRGDQRSSDAVPAPVSGKTGAVQAPRPDAIV